MTAKIVKLLHARTAAENHLAEAEKDLDEARDALEEAKVDHRMGFGEQ